MESITIKLEKIEDAMNPYNENVLKEELDNYIITSCQHIHSKEKIVLNINNFSKKEDQKKVENIIHTHYQAKVKQLNKIDKYDDYFRLVLLLLGIILIIISEQFTSLISELFLIAGWVVVWEVVYDILFTGIKRKRDLTLYKKLTTCQIIFLD